MDETNGEIFNIFMAKLNLLFEKVESLEFKFDMLSALLKRSQNPGDSLPLPLSADSNQEDVRDVQRNVSDSQCPVQFSSSLRNDKQLRCWALTQDYEHTIPKIFAVLDVQTLKNARFVCHTWNIHAVNALSNITLLDTHTWENNHNSKDEPIPLHEIYEMFESSIDNVVLFRDISFSFQVLSREMEIQVLLREFGRNLKCISLDTPQFKILKQVIDVCLGLEELTIYTGFLTVDDELFTINPDITLKLKSLKVIRQSNAMNATVYVSPIIEIIKASPDLISIGMADSSIFTTFFERLAPLPEVTLNIRELDLGGRLPDCKLPDPINLECVKNLNLRFKRNWGTSLVNKLSSTLEKLTLGFPNGGYFTEVDEDEDFGDDDDDDDRDPDNGDYEIFSQPVVELKRLKIFKLKGFISPDSSLKSFEFSKMKNLQTLYINVNLGDLETVLLQTDLCDPLVTLRKLTLIGTISCVLTFQIIATLFPNLVNLMLGLSRRYHADYSISDCLKDGLPKLATLPLTKLALYFDCSECSNVTDLVSSLKSLTALQSFEMGNFAYHAIVSGLYSGLKEVRQLSFVRLVNVLLILTEAMQIMDDFQSRGTTLEIIDKVLLRRKI